LVHDPLGQALALAGRAPSEVNSTFCALQSPAMSDEV
jgi:hypothetical protein